MNEYLEIVKGLIKSGINPSDYDTVKSYNLISLAIIKESPKIAKVLIRDGRSNPMLGISNALDEAIKKGTLTL